MRAIRPGQKAYAVATLGKGTPYHEAHGAVSVELLFLDLQGGTSRIEGYIKIVNKAGDLLENQKLLKLMFKAFSAFPTVYCDPILMKICYRPLANWRGLVSSSIGGCDLEVGSSATSLKPATS